MLMLMSIQSNIEFEHYEILDIKKAFSSSTKSFLLEEVDYLA